MNDDVSQQPVSSRRIWMNRLTQLHLRRSLNDVVNPVFWRDVVVEFTLCIFVECYVILVITTLNEDIYKLSTTHIALFVALFVVAGNAGYGPFSGTPVNPAGCWGGFLAGRMSAARSKYRVNPSTRLLAGVKAGRVHLCRVAGNTV